ncbi:hypothetical protein [Streptomyces qinglanensis]|uniref:hypothetical protein n=1 Tax=Streptomyces qinglanensis TaxID=943816 RepID=UPI003D743902
MPNLNDEYRTPDTPPTPAAPIREDRSATEPATLARCREDYDGTTDSRRRTETRAARSGGDA